MLKKILALGIMIGMVNAGNTVTYQEFIIGEGGRILNDIVENVTMPSDEVMQHLYDLSKNIDEGSYDVVRQILTGRWTENDGSISEAKADLIDDIGRSLYSKFNAEYGYLTE